MIRLMLVGADQAASAFRVVQLRRLAPRGHKLNGQEGKERLSWPIALMLVGAERAASAFGVILFELWYTYLEIIRV